MSIEINNKPIEWYLRNNIWTFPRMDGFEVNPQYRDQPTFRSKDRWHLRRQVGPYYISTVVLNNVEMYLIKKKFMTMVSRYNIFKMDKELGWYETAIEYEGHYEILGRYNSRHNAQKGHKEVIKHLKNLYNNSKEGKQEIPMEE